MDFLSLLHEVVKLNSWARTRDWGIPKYAIYWLKGEAIKKAISLNLCTHKKVFVTAKCRDCGGSGSYEDLWGCKFDHCRACGNSGIVHLRFVETLIQIDDSHQITWHTPWNKASFGHGLEWEGPWSMPAEGWTLNKPGQALSPIEAAKILNFTENHLNARRGVCTWLPPYDDFLYGPIDNFDYRLHLGSKDRICSVCGESRKEEIPCEYGAFKGKLQWTDFACKSCDEQAGGDKSIDIWKLFEPPEIANDPEIRIWEARHMEWFPVKD